MRKADAASLALLESMLQFNPYLRPSASELLKNPYFDEVRQAAKEKPASNRFRLDVDSDDNFDYETSLFKISKATLLHTIRMKIIEYAK